jgi:hypothetical protein
VPFTRASYRMNSERSEDDGSQECEGSHDR